MYRPVLTVPDAGMHRGHDVYPLTDILATKTNVLIAQLPVLAAQTAAITAKLADIVQAKLVCDQSATSCIIAIHAAADEQMAAVDVRANRDKVAIAAGRMSLLQQVSEIPHHTTLSQCDISLSFAKFEVGQLEGTGKAALCCEGVSNRFTMITEVLSKIAQLEVSDLPIHSGASTFQRTPPHLQAADITILGHLRDEDEHTKVCKDPYIIPNLVLSLTFFIFLNSTLNMNSYLCLTIYIMELQSLHSNYNAHLSIFN